MFGFPLPSMLAHSVLCLWATLNPKLSFPHLLQVFLCKLTFPCLPGVFSPLQRAGQDDQSSLAREGPRSRWEKDHSLLPSLSPHICLLVPPTLDSAQKMVVSWFGDYLAALEDWKGCTVISVMMTTVGQRKRSGHIGKNPKEN